jgi:hypothetical protein
VLKCVIVVACLERGFDQRPELIVAHGLTANQWHEFEEGHGATFPQVKFFLERFELLIVGQHDEGILLERLERFGVLGFPVEFAWRFQPRAVEGFFGIAWLDQSVVHLVAAGVEVLDFLVDAAANEFAGTDAFVQELEGETVLGFRACGFVGDGDDVRAGIRFSRGGRGHAGLLRDARIMFQT